VAREIEVKVTDLKDGSWTVGRNGSFGIQTMIAWTNQCEFVVFEFISRAQGVRLNAGFRIGFEDMTRLAKAWLGKIGARSDEAEGSEIRTYEEFKKAVLEDTGHFFHPVFMSEEDEEELCRSLWDRLGHREAAVERG